MRFLDNMTPQEIETLHLKGMIATNSERVRRMAEADGFGANAIDEDAENEMAQANKAKHSPLPPYTSDERPMLQDDGKREYTCSSIACFYDGDKTCQNCGYDNHEDEREENLREAWTDQRHLHI